MKNIWVVKCSYSSPNKQYRGQFLALAFLTEQEAEDYCAYHSTPQEAWTYEVLQIGKFTKPRKRKRT